MSMGITISFAGSPSMNAMSIYPSRPMSLLKGFKNNAECDNKLKSPIVIFAIIHIINPAGAATIIALAKTNKVLSNIECTITLPT